MIGIIGGVGPTAGADLVQKITEETVAGKDQEHLPIILYSLPNKIEDRTDFLHGKIKENPGYQIGELAIELSKQGATIGAVPCNTAHAPEIFDKVEEVVKKEAKNLKMINLIDENIAYLKQNFKKGTCIGILSTTGTYDQKIYFSKVKKAGFNPVVPSEDVQRDMVHAAIYHPLYGIKSKNGKVTKVARAQLQFVMDLMKAEGAEAVILGCTELPLAFEECTFKDMLLIDATRILARAIIREYDDKKLKEDSYQELIQK